VHFLLFRSCKNLFLQSGKIIKNVKGETRFCLVLMYYPNGKNQKFWLIKFTFAPQGLYCDSPEK
jgi:hypothetical protein